MKIPSFFKLFLVLNCFNTLFLKINSFLAKLLQEKFQDFYVFYSQELKSTFFKFFSSFFSSFLLIGLGKGRVKHEKTEKYVDFSFLGLKKELKNSEKNHFQHFWSEQHCLFNIFEQIICFFRVFCSFLEFFVQNQNRPQHAKFPEFC